MEQVNGTTSESPFDLLAKLRQQQVEEYNNSIGDMDEIDCKICLNRGHIAYLAETFRVVEEVERRTSAKGKETVLYACYPGTSQFSKKEMADFIEVLIIRAYNEGLDILQYEDLLKGGNNE